MNKVSFKGSGEECLRHYAKHFWPPKGAKNAARSKQPMADFLGVGTDTVTSWLSDRNKPLGEPLVRLQFFLEAVGYEVAELANLRIIRPLNYRLAEMLAYGVLPMDEAIKELDFTDSHSVLRLSHGTSNTSSNREKKIQALYEKHKSALAEAKAQLMKRVGGFEQVSVQALPVRTNPAEGQVDDESISILAHFVLAITPLLEKAVTDTTREQRNKLRSLTGSDGMFRLSKASSRLCSEKAREIVSNER
ncbi:MAG: hypothetical protein ACM3KM_03025 [Acidobacteriaceae bacterium]